MFNVCMRDCYDTCSLITMFENGKLTVRGNPEHPITRGFLCPKGALLPKWFYSGDRLKVPLIRTGKRGEQNFREASWNEAISTVAKRLRETIDRYGSESVLVYQYAGDRGIINYSFPLRLFHYLNASMLDYGICDRAGQEALKDVYGTAVGLDPEMLRNQKLIVYWGVNAFWTNIHGFILAEKLGLERWTVDVLKTETAKRSDKFFQIKPGTDVLFALGVAKIIIENELYDEEFIRENSFGFEEFMEYASKIDSGFVARKTGIKKGEIEEFAFEYAQKKGVIHIGYGMQRSLGGGEAVRAISLLPALVGHKFGFIYDMKTIDKSYAEGAFLRKGKVKRIPQMKLAEYVERGDIKFLYIYNANPLASLPNQNRLRKAFEKNDIFVVVHDIFLTDTALFADVVLPANTFFERLDIADSYYHRYIALNEPVGQLYGKSNYEVAKMLAEALEIENPYLYEPEEEIIGRILEENGLSFEELKKKGFIRVPEEPRRYLTPSGKIEFFSQRAVKRGLKPFPEYRPFKGEGLQLLSPTHRMTITSQYHNTHGIVDPNLYMNPEDAEIRGIGEGEIVEVYNERGAIKTRVRLTKDVPPGTAVLYKAFWPKILGWNVNFLTTDEVDAGYGNSSAYHSTWVNVRKADVSKR